MKLELRRWLTVPLRMNRRQVLILCIFIAIFGGALFVRLLVTFTHGIPLGRDGPYNMYNTVYVLEHWPSMKVTDPPLFFHFGALTHVALSPFGSSLMSSFNVATSLASGLVALTTFLMMRRLTKNTITALVAAFFAAFVPASFRMFGELQKNAFGVTLTPLFVLFLWRGLDGGRKLDLILAGIVLGAVGLTHELAFGTIVIAYISYLAFLLAYRRRIPWREIKLTVIVAIIAALISGAHYYGKLGSIATMAGEEAAPSGFAQAGFELQQPPQGQIPGRPQIYQHYYEFIGQLLFVLAAFGVGVAVYRRRPADFFLLAWAMSALVMAQPWVDEGYYWRFPLMLATPVVLLAAVGLIEGIGPILWKAGKNLRASSGEVRPSVVKSVTTAGRVAFILMFMLVIIQQARASYDYAWTGQMLRPTITMGEYEALQEFHDQVGDAYVFGTFDYVYWVDLAGLKGLIENGEVWSLNRLLRTGAEGQAEQALSLASEWYKTQQEVRENIYAVIRATGGSGEVGLMENGELFLLTYDSPYTRAYALSENFRPPQQSRGLFALLSLSAGKQPPPDNQQPQGQPGGPGPRVQEASPVLKLLLAPVYVLPSGAAKFLIGVPLTVMLWVLLPCLGWALVRRLTKSSEKLRKVLVACLVVILVLAAVLVVAGAAPPMQPGQGMPPGPYTP